MFWLFVVFAAASTIAVTLHFLSFDPEHNHFEVVWGADDLGENVYVDVLDFSPYDNSTWHKTGAFYGIAVQGLFFILFLCAVQGSQALALHGVELVVNLGRDESTWRMAYAPGRGEAKGARLIGVPCGRSSPAGRILSSSLAKLCCIGFLDKQ